MLTLILSAESASANGLKRESKFNPTLAKWQKFEVRQYVERYFFLLELLSQPRVVTIGIQSSLSRLEPRFLS
jgi:hypothetical protein